MAERQLAKLSEKIEKKLMRKVHPAMKGKGTSNTAGYTLADPSSHSS